MVVFLVQHVNAEALFFIALAIRVGYPFGRRRQLLRQRREALKNRLFVSFLGGDVLKVLNVFLNAVIGFRHDHPV